MKDTVHKYDLVQLTVSTILKNEEVICKGADAGAVATGWKRLREEGRKQVQELKWRSRAVQVQCWWLKIETI